jgi:hypothetical protein
MSNEALLKIMPDITLQNKTKPTWLFELQAASSGPTIY